MFSYNITLNEFVRPIPICQLEADLGSILQIFHQTNCESLAILTQNRTWGIIGSCDILSFLAKSWQKFPIATVGHPKQIPHQREAYGGMGRDWYSIIQPTTVYQAETSLEKFLDSLEDSYLRIAQNNYLIVNRAGELQGKLDRDRLLRYIAAKLKQRRVDFESANSSNPLLSLLDNLALPLKIETTERKHCYENRCWQKLISHNRDNHSVQSEKLNASIADWWMKKQLNMLQHYDKEQNKATRLPSINNNISRFCCLGDPGYSLPKSNVLSQTIDSISINTANLTAKQPLTNDSIASCSIEEPHLEQSKHDLGIQIEEDIEWNYIKIPLYLEDERLPNSQSATQYWLILALESFFALPNNRQLKKPFSAHKYTVDRLLTTVSHELKSPLTGIVGLSNLLNSQQIGSLNQRQVQYVKLIRNSGKKLMSIVNNLIELTNLTRGKFKLQPEAINLELLFARLYQQILTKFEAANSTELDLLMLTSGIEVDIQPGAEIAIADKLRLSSILSHLILEAIQSDDASSMALKIAAKKLDRYYCITVENRGIDTSVLLPQSNTADESKGLNLIIAEYLARAIQGEIKDIYFAKGCSFTLLLPIIKLQPNDRALSNQATNTCKDDLQNLTILCLYPELEVIDSSIDCDRNLSWDLKQWSEQNWSKSNSSKATTKDKYRIIEADGLEQAHTLARIWQLDAIVIDGYQIVDSYKYLETLQKSDYLSALPLITLDTKTTEAGNQIEGLNVYPCLLPAQCRSMKDLIQVIQIATEKLS